MPYFISKPAAVLIVQAEQLPPLHHLCGLGEQLNVSPWRNSLAKSSYQHELLVS